MQVAASFTQTRLRSLLVFRRRMNIRIEPAQNYTEKVQKQPQLTSDPITKSRRGGESRDNGIIHIW